MAYQLPSRVFSSSTLMAGLTLVKEEKDVDKLDGDDATLMSELQQPQVGLFVSIGIDTHL